jgi:hypothetical protein
MTAGGKCIQGAEQLPNQKANSRFISRTAGSVGLPLSFRALAFPNCAASDAAAAISRTHQFSIKLIGAGQA